MRHSNWFSPFILLICCLLSVFAGCTDSGKKAAKGISESDPPEDQICAAAMSGDLSKVKTMIESDPTLIDALTNDGKTPLHCAASFGQNSVVQFLLEKGALIGAEDDNGEAPIDSAIQNGHKDTAQVIINYSKAHPASAPPPQS